MPGGHRDFPPAALTTRTRSLIGHRPALSAMRSRADRPVRVLQRGPERRAGSRPYRRVRGGFYRASITLGAMSAGCRVARRYCGCQRGRPGHSKRYALRHSCPWRQGARTCLIAVRGNGQARLHLGQDPVTGRSGGDHGQPEPRQGRNRGIRCCGGSRWVLSLCVVFGPAWIAGNGSGLTTADRLAAENDVRSTLLQGFGGLLALGGVAVGTVMTLRQVRANREGHSIDLFTKAIDQLASDQVLGSPRRCLRPGTAIRTRPALPRACPRPSHRVRPSASAMAAPHSGTRMPAARTPVHGGVADDVEPHWPYSAGGR